MKVHPLTTAFCLSTFMSITFASCKKIVDEIKKNPGNGVASDCRIDKIISATSGYYGPDGELIDTGHDTAYFSYNRAGNPTMIKHTLYRSFQVGTPLDMVFKYDSQNRLIAYLRNYRRDSATGVDFAIGWAVYKYNPDGTITATVHALATATYSGGNEYESIKTQPQNYDGSTTYVYTLDEYGRIKSSKKADGTITNYNYDATGNLIMDGAVYSNNLNYLQTNKVWMFTQNNYSVNAKTAPLNFYSTDDFPTSFNVKKLPVNFSVYPAIADFRADSPLGESIMIYTCK